MIEINLLPEELRKRKRQSASAAASQINLQGIPFLKIAAMAVGGITIIQLAVFAIGFIYGTNYNLLGKNYKI